MQRIVGLLFHDKLIIKPIQLISRWAVEDDRLNQTNIGKLLPRLMKKGGQEVKDLSQKIIDNTAAFTKRKQESAKSPSKESSPNSKSTASGGAVMGTDVAGAKRSKDGESNNLPSKKRITSLSNAKNGVRADGAGGTVVPAKRPQESSYDSKTTNAPASRPRANIVAPKPTSLFGSLTSASKKPGTSNAERAAAAAAAKRQVIAYPSNTPLANFWSSAPPEKKETPAPAPPKQPTFSFGDLMADLNKPKEEAPAKLPEQKPPETEEERNKRLRKEARRKLRVTWKPAGSLTEVRLFTHDPEEELGPSDGSRGEAGDVKGEGRVLKLSMDLDDEEEEDGGGGAGEVEFFPYRVPSGLFLAFPFFSIPMHSPC